MSTCSSRGATRSSWSGAVFPHPHSTEATARDIAVGEFGAVSVVSGHIRGLTNTVPLHVEILYNEYNFVAAFAVASLLALLALVTLVVKTVVERQVERQVELQVELSTAAAAEPATGEV